MDEFQKFVKSLAAKYKANEPWGSDYSFEDVHGKPKQEVEKKTVWVVWNKTGSGYADANGGIVFSFGPAAKYNTEQEAKAKAVSYGSGWVAKPKQVKK